MNAIDWPTLMRDDYALATRAIRKRMPRCLQAAFDPEDFVADAIADLVANPSPYAGVQTLILIAGRRMIDTIRSPRGRVTQPLELCPYAPAPSAHDQVAAGELLERLTSRYLDPRDKAMVELRSAGCTLPQIAAKSGLELRTVQRFFHSLARDFP